MVTPLPVLAVVEQFWHRLPGGTAAATEATLAALVEQGDCVLDGLAAAHRPAARADPGRSGRWPGTGTLSFHRLPRPLLYEAWLRAGYASVDRYVRPGGLVWAASLVVPPTSAPVVATVHDLDFLANPEQLTSRGREFFPRLWQAAMRRAAVFVCPSETVAAQVRSEGVDGDRIAVVPWGVSPPTVPGVDGDGSRRQWRGDLPARFVLWVGPTLARKNAAGAVAAMAAVDHDLVVVGGAGGRGDTLDPFAALGDRVKRLGTVSAAELVALYQWADALLYPSFSEGFGLPVLEAMANGLPVVTSLGTATEEISGGAALLVDPHDSEGIGHALAVAVADSSARSALIEAGRERAAGFSWRRTAEGYARVFRSVALEASPPSAGAVWR